MIALKGIEVSVSKPVLVARSKGYLWFPTMTRLANGELFAVLSPDTNSISVSRITLAKLKP